MLLEESLKKLSPHSKTSFFHPFLLSKSYVFLIKLAPLKCINTLQINSTSFLKNSNHNSTSLTLYPSNFPKTMIARYYSLLTLNASFLFFGLKKIFSYILNIFLFIIFINFYFLIMTFRYFLKIIN